MKFTTATRLDEALQSLAAGARPIAGGTDLVVGARVGKMPLPDHLVAIDRIAELGTVEVVKRNNSEWLRIGAAVSHATIETNQLVCSNYSALADASALVGSPATRNVGTIGGNIMNASPAMETGAPLLCLGAVIELRSTTQSRMIAASQLWTGPGQTIARSDELCVGVLLPEHVAGRGSAYVRLEYRRAMEIAVVGAAARVDLAEDGTVANAALALTSVAATVLPVEGINELLAGRSVDASSLDEAASYASEAATPISDVRASEVYRRHTVGVMARRSLDAAARRARGEPIPIPVNRASGIGAAR